MGLDIYAGTLVRYYTRNWKTANQQFCEANGFGYQQIRANNTPAPPVEDVLEGVNNWEKQLVEVLHNSGVPSAEVWEEDNEKPYYTSKPDWDALNALLLYAASKILGDAFPKEFKKNTDIFEHPLMKKMYKDNNVQGWSLFNGICYWLPINDSVMFHFPLPNGAEADIAAVKLLKNELMKINEIGWNVNRETIIGWSGTEGYPVDFVINNGKIEQRQSNDVYDTESLAKFAFSLLWEAAEFSEKEKVPIILDF